MEESKVDSHFEADSLLLTCRCAEVFDFQFKEAFLFQFFIIFSPFCLVGILFSLLKGLFEIHQWLIRYYTPILK